MTMVLRVFGVCLCVLLLTKPAYAYVDPATAILILQGLIGVLAGIGLHFRRRLHALLGLFRRGSETKALDAGHMVKESDPPESGR